MSARQARQLLDKVSKELGIQQQSEWYGVQYKTLRRTLSESETLIRAHNGSMIELFKNAYSEYEWYPWLFSSSPPQFWKSKENRIKFFDWIAEVQGIETQADWYKLSKRTVDSKYGGKALLQTYYNASLYQCLKSLYPQYEWYPWLFQNCPLHWWEEDDNQRRYLDWFKEEHGIDTMDKWYQITREDIIRNKGRSLLLRHSDSLIHALCRLYPHLSWNTWLFPVTSRNHWKHKENVEMYLKWLKDQLGIRTIDDWQSIHQSQVRKLGGSTLMSFGGLRYLISKMYPMLAPSSSSDVPKNVSDKHSKMQLILCGILQTIFAPESQSNKPIG